MISTNLIVVPFRMAYNKKFNGMTITDTFLYIIVFCAVADHWNLIDICSHCILYIRIYYNF